MSQDKHQEENAPSSSEGPKTFSLKSYFPWPSIVLAILVMLFLVSINSPLLIQLLSLDQWPIISRTEFLLLLPFLSIALFIVDFKIFKRRQNDLRTSAAKLEKEVAYNWESKKKLQEKAQVYSDHAEKLKLFISDKLLEHIEYDEKFLHFKSVAAEVRHNGVISYDIVRRALEEAAKNTPSQDSTQLINLSGAKSLAETHRFGLPNYPDSDYQQALDAMKYLWDLLDLSTAENIATHIGKFLIECEEQYYQLEFADREELANDQPLFKPHFSPSFAAIKTLGPMIDSAQMDAMIAKSLELEATKENQGQYYEDELFRIYLEPTENLLGNENHVILLLENLVKNAQFFSGKSINKQSSDRISLQLKQKAGYIQYSVYNRGPHIKDSDLAKIFQLGFSTRKIKEHHGKGLGLFFTNEIVKGYHGKIITSNINNQDDTYSIRIELENGEIFTKVIEARNSQAQSNLGKQKANQLPKLKETSDDTLVDKFEWAFDSPIASIEFSSARFTTPQKFTNIKNSTILSDPHNPFSPQWKIELGHKGKQYQCIFSALDVSGVQFDILLPTAESLLNGEEPEFDEDLSEEVDRLKSQFKEFGDF